MARIRSIKPEFWSDGSIIECSTNARLLFIGTWTFSDNLGNLDRSAKQIKAQVFPADDFDCEPLIQELLIRGLLVEYSSNGKKYLHIHSFTKHQKIDRPGQPRCPIFDDSSNTQRTIVEPSTTIQPRKGREGKGVEGKGSKPKAKIAAFNLPDWIPKASWQGFEDMRNRCRKPLTDRARQMIITELERLKATGQDPIKVLAQSEVHSWADVYAIKPNGGQQPPNRADALLERNLAAIEPDQQPAPKPAKRSHSEPF